MHIYMMDRLEFVRSRFDSSTVTLVVLIVALVLGRSSRQYMRLVIFLLGRTVRHDCARRA